MPFSLHQFSGKHAQKAWNDYSYNILTQHPRCLEPQALHALHSRSTQNRGLPKAIICLAFKNIGIFQLAPHQGAQCYVTKQPHEPASWHRPAAGPCTTAGCQPCAHPVPAVTPAHFGAFPAALAVAELQLCRGLAVSQGSGAGRLGHFSMEAQGRMTSQLSLQAHEVSGMCAGRPACCCSQARGLQGVLSSKV